MNMALSTDDIKLVVQETVHETLIKIGFDLEHPVSTQQDIAFLRKSRKRCESVIAKLVATLVTAGVLAGFTGAGWAIIEFVKQTGG